MEAWSQKYEDYYRKAGFDDATIRNLRRQQERQYNQEQTSSAQEEAYTNTLNRIQNKTGAQVDLGTNNILFDGQTYNPFTGSYTVKGDDPNKPAYWYDADTKQTYLGGINMGFDTSGQNYYDPRIATSLNEEDYGVADSWVKDIEDRIQQAIEHGSRTGEISHGYKIETDRSRVGLFPGADPSENYAQDAAERIRGYNIGDYLERADPELYKQYKMMQSPNFQAEYLKQAYGAGSSRLGETYQDNYFDTLKSQYAGLDAGSQDPAKTYGIGATDSFLNNPNMSDAVKRSIVQDSMTKGLTVDPAVLEMYGLVSQPSQAAPSAPGAPATPPAPQSTQYAESMLSGGEVQKPWSTDFEKQFLDQIKSIGSYLGQQKSSTPNYGFSLGYGSSGTDTGQRNSGMVASSPTYASGATPAGGSPSTGKAGPSNQTSMWS